MTLMDIERQTLGVTNEELRSAVTRRNARLPEPMAAKLLLSRERARPVSAARLILGSRASQDSKVTAVRRLGRTMERGAQDLLVGQLKTRDVRILKQSVLSLARIGDEEALEALKRIKSKSRSLGKGTLDSAMRLIAFRNGLAGHGVKARELAKRATMGRGLRAKMEIQPVRAEALERFRAKIDADGPGLDLHLGPATEVNCLGKPLWLIPSKLAVESPATLARRTAVPMAIYTFDACTESPYIKAYVYSEPKRGGINLYVSRLRGQISHQGSAKLTRRGFEFNLDALDTRFDPAARLAGALDDEGLLRVDSAEVSMNFRRQLELRKRPTEAVEDA